MLRVTAERCTDILLRYGIIRSERKAVYIYGFELLGSLIFSGISILALGSIFHYMPFAVVFLVYFVPIRVPAGGFHASSYEYCFLFSNITAIICVCTSRWLYQKQWEELVLWGMLLLSAIYIWFEAPVISKKHFIKEKRITKNRNYTRFLLVFDLVGIWCMKIVTDGQVVFTAIVTLYVVAFMIFIAKEGGR